MNILQAYPGTPEHQTFLRAIVSYYMSDPRILAIIVFGSIGRDNWDPYSDLDLDIIVGDDIQINVLQELEHVIYSLLRGLLMELFALSHNKPRPLRCFQEEADGPLQALLGSTLAQFGLLSIQKALFNLLDILEYNLELFTGRKMLLTQAHRNIIKQVRARQHNVGMHGM